MKNSIIDDVISYLNFYQEHLHYTLYKDEIESKRYDEIAVDDNNPDEGIPEKTNPADDDSGASITIKDKEIQYSLAKESWMDCSDFGSFENEIRDCAKCKLLARTRKQVVFGTGNPDADIVVVGEAPGADEDEQGKPFVGRAGKLLTDILKAINFTREEVFICNILKCRPPENRNPLPDEIENCEPYLFKQLEMIKPKLILAVGTFAAQTLLRTKEPLGRLRGKFHDYKGIKMMVTYHPAALLRNPGWKRPTWEDVQLFRNEYDRIRN
jgi:DNA polymerase